MSETQQWNDNKREGVDVDNKRRDAKHKRLDAKHAKLDVKNAWLNHKGMELDILSRLE